MAIPGYEVLGELGRGGMGVVYRARHARLNRVVALKMILSAHARSEEVARFRAEAEAVARFQHPNIVQIYEVGEHQGRPFFSLELVEGGSLDRRVAGTPQPPAWAAGLVTTLASAMHVAHQRGIIHRDLKPGNVLLTADGTPKISDFGLAKQVNEQQPGQTHTGVILGTPSYMAPEQAHGRTKEVSPVTDVYALGAVLYELLTGRPPFKGATLLDTLEQVRSQEPVPPSRLQAKVPRDLETICLKCLQKEPRRRYASAAELAADLGRFLNGEPIQARPVGTWERGAKWAKRNPAMALLVAVSLVAVLSMAGGVFLYQEWRARAAEDDAREAARVLDQEREDDRRLDAVRQHILKGDTALASKDFQAAKLELTLALEKAGSEEPAFGALRARGRALLGEVERGLTAVVARQKDRADYEAFLKHRDDAFFHSTLATGEGLAANARATRDAGRAALALCGVSPGGGSPRALRGLFAERKREVLAACYGLLLVLAEVETLTGDGQGGRESFSRALRVLDQAAGLDCPDHPTQAYHLRRARYLEQLGRLEDARREKALAGRRPAATALDHYLLGDEWYKQGSIPEAAQAFERALAVEPENFWARYFLSVAYLRLQRPAEARAGLTVCLQQRPTFIWVYLLRGFAHGQLNDYRSAADDFDAALRLGPSADARHVLYANRGVLWFQQGKLDNAVADLRAAIGLKPTEYQARVTLAQVYQRQRKWADAAAVLGEAVRLEPDLAFLHRLRARLHLEREEPDLAAALADIDRAIALEARSGPSPALARDHAQRGRILYRGRRHDEALAAYTAALQTDRDCTTAHLWLAEAQLRLERHREAVGSLGEYLKRGGKPTAEVYHARGMSRTRLGEYPGAIHDLTLAINLRPAYPGPRASRGWAYLASGAPQLAEADFGEAIRLDPGKADFYNGRGYSRAKLGRDREAVADAEEALRRGAATPRLLHDAGRADADPAQDRAVLEWRRHCEGRALGSLRAALRSLPPGERRAVWHERIRPDAALVPIRTSPGFVELDREYAAPGRPSTPLP